MKCSSASTPQQQLNYTKLNKLMTTTTTILGVKWEWKGSSFALAAAAAGGRQQQQQQQQQQQ